MAALSLSLLLPLSFVIPPALRTAGHRARAGQTCMCQWDDHDEAALHNAIAKCHSTTRLGEPGYALQGLNSAYVLIFNPGKPDEGVYTLQGAMTRASAYVLTFESTDDADRFAQLLQAEGFDLATAMQWEVGQLEAFCHAGEFEVSMVPAGSLITPPAKNEFDIDAFNKLDEESDESQGQGMMPRTDAYTSERAALERLFLGPTMSGSEGKDMRKKGTGADMKEVDDAKKDHEGEDQQEGDESS